MILKKGQTVTAALLNSLFKILKRSINEITSVQINVLTTSQIIDVAVWNTSYTITVSPMSSCNEQYFDSSFIPQYNTGVDGNVPRGNNSYLFYYLDEIEKINSME